MYTSVLSYLSRKRSIRKYMPILLLGNRLTPISSTDSDIMGIALDGQEALASKSL